MDPMAGLDRCGKSRLPPGFDPWTVQPVASRYIFANSTEIKSISIQSQLNSVYYIELVSCFDLSHVIVRFTVGL